VAAEALDAAGAPPAPADLGLKTVFELSEPRRLAALAGQAGWSAILEEPVDFTMDIPETAPEEALDRMAQLSRKVQLRAEALDAAGLGRARAELAARVRAFVRGRDLGFPARALLVSGRA
ncbi:MAG TPA: hypothetical protein VFD43_08605, partial [Planctomycetota bacterium]|nr:hypothetical protein [Planctomycetota bacterium]